MEPVLELISIDKQVQIDSQSTTLEDVGERRQGKLSEGKEMSAESKKPQEVKFYGKTCTYWALMILSGITLLVGVSSASLLGRLYFVNGGSRRWVYTWIESAGWPVLLIPLILCYAKDSRCARTLLKQAMTPRLCLVYIAMGFLSAFDNLLYSIGLSYLPVSTNSMVCASQLAFNAIFAYILVGHKLSAYSINSIVVISAGTIILGLSAEDDRPPGTTAREYIVGIVVTIIASAIYGFILPVIQLIYTKGFPQNSSPIVVVLEVQVAMSAVASAFSLLGMFVHGDFSAMTDEAHQFHSGSTSYVLTLLFSAIGWQLFFLGCSGIIFLSSSLMSCVFMTAMLPILPILAVIFFHDKFSGLKSIALLLSIWGFISYIYGGYKAHKSQRETSECQLP